MKKIFILFIAIILSSAAVAQLEVKKDSFKLVEGFVLHILRVGARQLFQLVQKAHFHILRCKDLHYLL